MAGFKRTIRLAIALIVMSTVVASAAPSAALGEDISVVLGQTDGTPDPPTNSWDTDDNPGNDSGPNNGIVRTNDVLRYDVEVRVEAGNASNVTISIPLPIGAEATSLPPFCLAGSSSITPAIPPPVVPITAASWAALPQQTLVCNVGPRAPGSTLTYPFTTTVRSEVPQGTVLGPVTAEVTSDDVPVPVVSNEVNATVSARPKYDLSKNAISFNENGGYLGGGSIGACPGDPAKQCFNYLASILIAAQDGGKGSAPLASPIVITDDLSPISLYGAPNGYLVTTDPDWIAAGANALQMYGARLRSCPNTSVYTAPGIGVGVTAALTETNAVRDSGTISCTQPGGPGTPVTITITNADTSAYTVPTESYYPNGNAIPVDQGYIVAGRIDFGIPVDAVRDLGVANGTGGFDLRWDNIYTEFDAVAVDGTPNDPAANPYVNDHRAVTSSIRTRGSWDKAFLGVPAAPGNTPPSQFRPGWQVWEGPTNVTAYRTGDGVMLPTQHTISGLQMHNTSTSGEPVSFMMCDNWDNTKLRLAPDNYGPSAARMQLIPSGGAAVWFSGFYTNGAYATTTAGTPPLVVEYGTGPAGNTETCDDADSPSGWFSNPASVPGGIAAVSKVRLATTLPASTTGGTYSTVSIGLEALPNPTGTILPNWASGKVVHGTHTLTDMVASAQAWNTGTYNPANATGTLGDRLVMGSAISRLNKDVWDNSSSSWVNTTPTITGNTNVDYRLSPSLTAGISSGVTVPVTIEDCLPLDQTYVNGSATVPPTIIQFGSPAGSMLTCPAGQIFLRWDLGPQVVGATIAPIEFTALVSAASANGVYTNNAIVGAEGDPSDPSLRTAAAQVQVIQPAGVAIEKVALTPQLDINRPGEPNLDQLLWQVSFRNLDLPGAIADVDVIDVLPANGLNGTTFTGSLTFDHATVTSGTGLQILYTSETPTNIDLDAYDPTNDSVTGSTVWCDLPAGGVVIAGAGAATDCPASAGDVTGLRILRPGVFPPNELFMVEVGLVPSDNTEGDIYVNGTAGRAQGLALPVGPVLTPEVIVASSLGNRVWRDTNGNGLQDVGEIGVDGVIVEMWGIDTDGNPVGTSTVPLTTVTAGGGLYLFDELPAGTYEVRFDDATLATDDRWTGQDQDADDLADSDGDPVTGIASGTVVGTNADVVSVDQGIVRLPDLSGFVYIDTNDDADRTGETGIPGVTVTLTGTDNLGNPVTLTTATGANGSYSFPDLWPGNYTVTEDQSTIPTPYLDGQDTAGSLGGDASTTNDVIASISLTDTDSIENNFGEIPPASISGIVFADENEDGTYTPGETPIGGVTVTLTGTDDLGNPVSVATTTAPDGTYSFTGLRPGDYTVTETQPLVWIDGDDEAGSHGGNAGDDVIDTIVLGAGDDGTGYNFGEIPLDPGMSIVKTVNTDDANVAPGILVDVDAPVTFDYLIANTGNVELIDVALVDDVLGAITCPQATLAVDEFMTCSASGVAVEGSYTNVGSARSQPIDPQGLPYGDPIEAEDPANYFGGTAGIELIKRVNGDDANTAPGPFLTVGQTATFTYEVSNTGNLTLTNVALDDDVIGDIECPKTTLIGGESMTCSTTEIVERDSYVNVGEVEGQPVFTSPLGEVTPVGEPLTADDPAHYYGELTEISLVKRVNGDDANTAPGISVAPGESLVFTYEITNTGNIDLADITLNDDVLGSITCPGVSLVAGASMVCSFSSKADGKQVTNIGTVTGQRYNDEGVAIGGPVTDLDYATYTTRSVPSSLAFTGATTGVMILASLALMVVGAGFIGAARRRNSFS